MGYLNFDLTSIVVRNDTFDMFRSFMNERQVDEP